MKYFLFCVCFVFSCGASEEVYQVAHIQGQQPLLDGRRDEKFWQAVQPVTGFMNPWNREVEPATALSLAYSTDGLYFHFDVRDNEVILANDFRKERDIEMGDRVELFFSKDKNMGAYYCFEVDAAGRVLSYAAQHYRKMNYDWEPPVGFRVAARRKEGGYAVEGVVPTDFLENLGTAGVLYMGAYRAEFSRRDSVVEENWLTWVNPATTKPDFHVPSSLCKVSLK